MAAKKITLITTGQPTTNPRLVKEAEALIKAGFDVKVICCFYERWAEKFDQGIIARHPSVYFYYGGTPFQNKWLYFFTRARQKLAIKLVNFSKNFGLAELALNRAHAEALALAKQHKSDLYIAHNLGALPAAVMAAAYHKVKVGYDAEDMHSGQYHSVEDKAYQLNLYAEQKYFPLTSYFTAASELIGKAYQDLYPYLQPLTIDNVFPKTSLQLESENNGPVKLFWFSQTIGIQRGIENIVSALALVETPVELHLLGNCAAEFKNNLYTHAAENGIEDKQLHFHEPIPADELFNFSSQFDIGIASETAYCLNNDIALSNKVFTYIQSGLAVLASDTKAQSLFISQYPAAGKLYKKDDAVSVAEAIRYYAENRDLLSRAKKENYQLGQTTLNWETESKKFLDLIHQILPG